MKQYQIDCSNLSSGTDQAEAALSQDTDNDIETLWSSFRDGIYIKKNTVV